MKIDGAFSLCAGSAKPGENAMMWLNRAPLSSPSDRAYEAPSEKPASAIRAQSRRS